MVAIRELLDPSLTSAIRLQIQHARQRLAVVRPAAAVFDEVLRLRCGAAAAVREVVAASQETGIGGAREMLGEFGVGVGCSFCCFDVDEAQAARFVGGVEVDVGLVVRDVEALDFGAFAEGGRR